MTTFLTPISILAYGRASSTASKVFRDAVMWKSASSACSFRSIFSSSFFLGSDADPHGVLIGIWAMSAGVYAAVKFVLYTMRAQSS